MCSLNDDVKEFMISKQSSPQVEKVCRSCYSPAKVVLRRKDAYCKSCFLNSSTHKFRATLGKSKMMKSGDRVLVLFSGNYSSMALLHFLHSGLNAEANKRLMFNVDLLFIDEGLIINQDVEKRKKLVDQLKSKTNLFGFELLVAPLSEVLSETPKVGNSLSLNVTQEDKLSKIFQNIKTTTAKEDLLHQLRYKLLNKIAKGLDYNKIFTSEVATDLAVKLLVGMSLGRGDQIPAEVGFCDNRSMRTPLLRPLRDFTQKEIVFYNVFNELEPINVAFMTTTSSSNASIHKTTENFVNELQEIFPSTVYTIFRTGDKLKMSENYLNEENQTCVLCDRTARRGNDCNSDVSDALDIYKLLDQSKHSCGNCSCQNSPDSLLKSKRRMCLCYGCSLIFMDVDNKQYIQEYLLEAEMKLRNLECLRKQISEFLIDDSS